MIMNEIFKMAKEIIPSSFALSKDTEKEKIFSLKEVFVSPSDIQELQNLLVGRIQELGYELIKSRNSFAGGFLFLKKNKYLSVSFSKTNINPFMDVRISIAFFN